MKKSKVIVGFLSVVLLTSSQNAKASQWWFFGKKTHTESASKPAQSPAELAYEKLVKGEKVRAEGMFTLHFKDGKVLFEVPLDLLGREYVMGSTIKSTSDNSNGVVGSKPLELKHFTLVKVDSTIQMRRINSDYYSTDSNIESALSRSRAGFLEKSFKIKAYKPDSTAVVFDATSVFLSDDKEMSPFSEIAPNAQYFREDEFKSDLSYITDVKAFEDNVSVTSSMTYVYSLKNRQEEYVVYNRPLTAELTRSILILPEEVYHPRMADYRIGVFFTERSRIGDLTTETKPVYLANRWRVEPSDTAAYRRGELVEPVKPIVWYIDNDFPEWWKPYIFEAVLQWNEPFEEIGFKNVMQAKPFPTDDPSFDPDNIRYNCIRYAPINVQNATGPSWVDPRSGEIINASVYVYHDIIKLINRWRFVQTAAADESVRTNSLPRDVMGDAIRYVITHEIGHTLGFMHNMSGSSVIPVEDLRSPEVTSHTGTTTSIMDYARFNYVAQPGDKERGVKLTPPRFGDYDRWLVRWTYTPVFDMTFEQESKATEKWISDALNEAPYYRYGKQQFMSLFFDPRSQTEDLGDDVVKATKYGVANLKYITEHFMDWLEDGDDDFEDRLAIYNAIIGQYLTYAQHVTMNVGGLYKNEIKNGDGQFRYKNVPSRKQKEALDYLFTLWNDVDWIEDRQVLSRLPVVGSPKYSIQQEVSSLILYTPILASFSDGIDTKEYSAAACMKDIADRVFAPSRKGKSLNASQRRFQNDFVFSYMTMGAFPIPGRPSSVALSEDDTTGHLLLDQSCWHSGTIEPISGFEWSPRNIYNGTSELTKSDIYDILSYVYKIMEKAARNAGIEDRAHYKTLMDSITYSVKIK